MWTGPTWRKGHRGNLGLQQTAFEKKGEDRMCSNIEGTSAEVTGDQRSTVSVGKIEKSGMLAGYVEARTSSENVTVTKKIEPMNEVAINAVDDNMESNNYQVAAINVGSNDGESSIDEVNKSIKGKEIGIGLGPSRNDLEPHTMGLNNTKGNVGLQPSLPNEITEPPFSFKSGSTGSIEASKRLGNNYGKSKNKRVWVRKIRAHQIGVNTEQNLSSFDEVAGKRERDELREDNGKGDMRKRFKGGDSSKVAEGIVPVVKEIAEIDGNNKLHADDKRQENDVSVSADNITLEGVLGAAKLDAKEDISADRSLPVRRAQ
ncbi:hypothetical protein Q3G72_031160 [Acer saccharum]|nr:hypothetical protein Q3G72_031160 [Acer saccharum]